MWEKLRSTFGWIVAALLAIVGATYMWKRKAHQKAVNDSLKKKEALERAVIKAARRNKELNQKVKDARSRGTLADRFNE